MIYRVKYNVVYFLIFQGEGIDGVSAGGLDALRPCWEDAKTEFFQMGTLKSASTSGSYILVVRSTRSGIAETVCRPLSTSTENLSIRAV